MALLFLFINNQPSYQKKFRLFSYIRSFKMNWDLYLLEKCVFYLNIKQNP